MIPEPGGTEGHGEARDGVHGEARAGEPRGGARDRGHGVAREGEPGGSPGRGHPGELGRGANAEPPLATAETGTGGPREIPGRGSTGEPA